MAARHESWKLMVSAMLGIDWSASTILQRANGCVIDLHGSKIVLSEPVLIAIKLKSESIFLSPSDSLKTPLKPFVEASLPTFKPKKKQGAAEHHASGSRTGAVVHAK